MKNLKNIIAGAFIIGALVACDKEEVTPQEENNNNTTMTKDQASSGYGGSLAQFTIVDDYLYTIDYKTLNIFYLAGDVENPALTESINMPVGMETIFHQDGRLFIGANDGVHIYDISNPRSPVELSQINHITSCDPVVANGDVCIATLRGGTACGGNISLMDIIDISDINNPQIINELELINPYGLSFSAENSNIVYICDGYDGLKAFDISDFNNINEVMSRPDLEAFDIIANNDNLIVLTRTGIYQFDATNPTDLVETSFISVQ